MIELPEETLKLYQDSKKNFENQLVSIRQECKKIKEDFLSKDFETINSNSDISESYRFLLCFFPYLNHLIFFHNDIEIITKLKKYGFINATLKWMIDINEIEKEIKRLEQIDGLLIFPYEYLSNSIIFVQTNFQIETFDSFIGNVIYNGKETNKFYADLMNRIRRRNYKGIKKIKNPKSEYEYLMNEQLAFLEKLPNKFGFEKSDLLKIFLKLKIGNSGYFKESFLFVNTAISKNKVYIELFPLLKLILKNKILLSENDFYECTTETIYNNNYSLYRISKVRDIFNLK
jgi:hypothetical protein